MVWPYFSNVRIMLATIDTNECRKLQASNVEAKVTFVLRNLELNKVTGSPTSTFLD